MGGTDETVLALLQNHDGDGGAAAARLPLHRAEPHREGADPLNGAPRPDFQRCVQNLRTGILRAAAIRDSGSDIFLQVNIETKSLRDGKQITRYRAERMFTFVTSL